MPLKLVQNRKGVEILEFALVLPMFLLLIFAVVDFGLCFFAQHTLQYATREGVRLALVGRILNDASGNPMTREASIVKAIRDNAAVAVNPNAVQISIYPVSADFIDPTNWKNTQDAGAPGGYMRVRTSYTYHFMTPFVGSFVRGGNLLLQSEATYRNELFN